MVNWIGLAFPFVYLGILVGALSTFSALYRKRKALRAQSLEPWFGPHRERDIYLSLLHLDSEDNSPKVPESMLKSALILRAVEDIRRITQLRQMKSGVASLLQRGSIGDDLWQRFLRAEQEIEAEVRDVVSEANAFQEGWSQYVFQTANEIVVNQNVRKRMEEIQSQLPADKEWWEQRREAIKSEFMKELEEEVGASAQGKTQAAGSKHSDDEPVLIESGGPAASQHGGGGGKKKKKGKH